MANIRTASRVNLYGEKLGEVRRLVRKAESQLPIRIYNDDGTLTESTFRIYVYPDNNGEEHVAVIKSIRDGEDVPIRIHSSCLAEVFGATNCDCREQLEMSLAIANNRGFGGVIWLHQEGRGNGLVAKIMQLDIMLTKGVDTCTAFEQAGYPKDIRDYQIAAGILTDLDIKSIRIITNNPDKIEQLQSLGIVINGRIPCVPSNLTINPILERDLTAKKEQLGHLLD